MAVIVGAPVCGRGWILEEWFEHLANQEDFPPDRMAIVLNYGQSSDNTLEIILNEKSRSRFANIHVLVDLEGGHHEGHRFWSLDRYATMVRLRNDLLKFVRLAQPDYYLSCDTDMLLPPHTLRTLFENMGHYAGIGPVAFMTEQGENFPNSMDRYNNRHAPPTKTEQVYAVFGVVLMNEDLYNKVDYALHGQGEDLGWAKNAWEAQLPLAQCPEVRVKHVMKPDLLGVFDPRVGF